MRPIKMKPPRMKKVKGKRGLGVRQPVICLVVFALGFWLVTSLQADERTRIYNLSLELERLASELAASSYEHFKGWNQTITEEEQAVLFKSEALAASCRLFTRLAAEKSGYFRSGYIRTNLYNAFLYLARAFRELDEAMQQAGVRPYRMNDIQNLLERMEREFARWPSEDNLAYLHQKYVKGRDAAVYLIERRGLGDYVLHPFKDLESLYRYNYQLKRGKDPWKYLVQVREETLAKMTRGEMIELTFEGCLVIEMSNRPNRPVYLIENGRKRGVTSPAVLQRLGGWDKVYEVPAEVIAKYPEGEPIR